MYWFVFLGFAKIHCSFGVGHSIAGWFRHLFLFKYCISFGGFLLLFYEKVKLKVIVLFVSKCLLDLLAD